MQQQTKPKKSRAQSAYDNLWASPALFVFVSGVVFIVASRRGGDEGDRLAEKAWLVYFAGWAPLILMALWCLIVRRKPDIPAAPIGLFLAVAGGLFHLLLRHESLPF
ncbi:hypothetical protein [Streptomyces sp. NPDC047108]|uniref:hypothetical protein n=1 Tax=Streptomyces sp. NPDC047108 TaxID=3155025 RepID=UPI0033C29E06